MTNSIGIGLIGSGYMGKCHALAWTGVRPVFGRGLRPKLITLAEVDADLASRRANELGFANSTPHWRDLLDDPAIEVISITAPNQFHKEMAIAALEAGKHVWCEKPMATSLEDAKAMRDAAAKSDRITLLGYNYIQNPLIRHIAKLINNDTIGDINHLRLEMDEDYMADSTTPFTLKSDAASGFGALDDFGVHPLSLIQTLTGNLARVIAHQSKPYATRPTEDGTPRAVETFDAADILFKTKSGVSGSIALNRAAWGRKGRLVLQIFGSTGTILYDQERMNEFQLYTASDEPAEQGFRTILAGPQHPPYDQFIPAPGHGLGFNDLKIIECQQLLSQIAGREGVSINFASGYEIEKAVHAMARSHTEQCWISL